MSHPENCVSLAQIKRDLRSPLLILAGITSLAAAVFAVPGVGRLFDLEETNHFLLFLSLDYIDSSAQLSWLIVKWLVNMLALVVPLLTAVGLLLTLAASFCCREDGYPAWGVKYFSRLTAILRVILYVVSALLALLFAVRVVAYLVINGSQIGGVLFIFAMLLPELVLAVVVAIILYLTIRGIKSAELTADTVRLNVLSGKCEAYGLKSGAIWLVAMMGVAAIVLLVINREERASVVCFALAALSYFLLAAWLICYRKKNGRRALAKFRTNQDIFA